MYQYVYLYLGKAYRFFPFFAVPWGSLKFKCLCPHKVLQTTPNVSSPITIPLHNYTFTFLYYSILKRYLSMKKINAIQSDLQISKSTLLSSHSVTPRQFNSDKLLCQTLHRTFLLLFLCLIICNLIQQKHIIFLSAQFWFCYLSKPISLSQLAWFKSLPCKTVSFS